jgi:DNA-binding transcriptional MerR regulator
MRVLLPIGDFARMTHLTVKALRHYHELGLLEPAAVDPASGYRLYGAEQVPVAQVIRRFRDLGMPLDEIRAVLRAPDVAARNAVVGRHMRRMEDQLARTQAVVDSLRSLLDEPPPAIAVEHRTVGPVRAFATAARVDAAGLDDWWDGTFRALPAGRRGALYSPEFFTHGAGEVTAYVEADDGPHTIPPAELAVAVHAGPLADLDRTYGALGTYVAAREIGLGGPIREHYLVSAFDTDDESAHRTEVAWPIFTTKPA